MSSVDGEDRRREERLGDEKERRGRRAVWLVRREEGGGMRAGWALVGKLISVDGEDRRKAECRMLRRQRGW